MEWEQLDKRILNSYQMVQQLEEHNGIFIIEDQQGEWRFLKVVLEESIQLSLVQKLLSSKVEGVNRIVECFTAGGYCYLIKEYIHGSNLFEVILGEGTFSEKQAVHMLIELCQSLNDLYRECGLIFKDLHPKNIMMHQGKYVLVDTETVRVVKEDQSVDTQIIGVAGFMAPEQYGFAQSTIQSDMYSLGMIARFVLTGKIPTLKNNQILIDENEVSYALLVVLGKMTAFAPEKRYSDYPECLKALRLARKGREPISRQKTIIAVVMTICFTVLLSSRVNLFPEMSSTENTSDVVQSDENTADEINYEQFLDLSAEESVVRNDGVKVEDKEIDEENTVEDIVEVEVDKWWKVGKPVVNRAYWEAVVGLPFDADWRLAEYNTDDGIDQYLEDLSILYYMDETYIYYRFKYQTDFPSRVAMFSASNQKDHLFSFVNNGSLGGSNDWVLRLKREDIRTIGRENTGLLIDLFDTQPFERMFLKVTYNDELFTEEDKTLYVKQANVLNFHEVKLSLVEWFEGEWKGLDVTYLDGSEQRIHDVEVSALKTDDDIFINVMYPSRYPADVVIFLPGAEEGVQTRIEGGTRIGENQWTIRISSEEWDKQVLANGTTKLIMNLMLYSLDNPGSIMFEIP